MLAERQFRLDTFLKDPDPLLVEAGYGRLDKSAIHVGSSRAAPQAQCRAEVADGVRQPPVGGDGLAAAHQPHKVSHIERLLRNVDGIADGTSAEQLVPAEFPQLPPQGGHAGVNLTPRGGWRIVLPQGFVNPLY